MNKQTLLNIALQFGTPLYVYDADTIITRIKMLRSLFGARFKISYAIKSNPNKRLLRLIKSSVDTFDASSFAEVDRGIAAGMPPAQISFSGPAKRLLELNRAVDVRVGELVVESLEEASELSRIAQSKGVEQPCLVRLNPIRVPRKFGASMGGTASQFGVDEEVIDVVLPKVRDLPGLRLVGFHIYSGTNCLHADAIAENFQIFADLFTHAIEITNISPKRLIFGSGFGIPYLIGEEPLDHEALPELILPTLNALLTNPNNMATEPTLELGRWLVGPAGCLLTRVVREKTSRGKSIRLCDAGFNNHLAACGMLGSVLRRNWNLENLSNPHGVSKTYSLVGPLCTTIDRIAADIELPEVSVGDILSIPQSGAYGLTASPTRFISHPEPREVIIHNGRIIDATESTLNH